MCQKKIANPNSFTNIIGDQNTTAEANGQYYGKPPKGVSRLNTNISPTKPFNKTTIKKENNNHHTRNATNSNTTDRDRNNNSPSRRDMKNNPKRANSCNKIHPERDPHESKNV